jgi:hypothetical protein
MFVAFAAVFLAIYFLPTIVAMARKHPSALVIFVLNLLLGGTGVFWVCSLVWALRSINRFGSPNITIINNVSAGITQVSQGPMPIDQPPAGFAPSLGGVNRDSGLASISRELKIDRR